jgi:hypothetical protein
MEYTDSGKPVLCKIGFDTSDIGSTPYRTDVKLIIEDLNLKH